MDEKIAPLILSEVGRVASPSSVTSFLPFLLHVIILTILAFLLIEILTDGFGILFGYAFNFCQLLRCGGLDLGKRHCAEEFFRLALSYAGDLR